MNAPLHPSEYQIQIAVVDHLKLRARAGVYWFAVPNGGYIMDPRVVAKLKAMGLQPGAPDLVVLVYGNRPGGLELKSKRGTQSDVQEATQAAWEAAGGRYAVAKSLDEAIAVLASWGALR